MKIRPYTLNDLDACVELIRSNTPKYFTTEELEGCPKWFAELPETFWVVEDEGEVRALGGFYEEEKCTKLAWGLVHNAHHKKGYGKALLEYRLEKAKALKRNLPVRLDTAQHTYGFFEKYGFFITKITPDYYYGKLDKYEMEYERYY